MIKFGTYAGECPFILRIIENGDHNELKIIVALPVAGEPGTGCEDEENPDIKKILQRCTPIYPDENNVYEITFPSYIMYQIQNESYAILDDYEQLEGLYFYICTQSRLLDQVRELTLAEALEKSWQHYGIGSHTHIIDVISCEEPIVKKITLDFEQDDD